MRLRQQPGLQVQAVAAALDIHPFMLSKWRKQVREGLLHGPARAVRVPSLREIRRLQELERAHALLQDEHEILRTAIRFGSARRLTGLPSFDWQRRPLSAHAEQDRELSAQIAVILAAHRGRYGSPRIHRDLIGAGWRLSRRRVERLMRAAGLRARVARVYRASPALHRFFGQHPNRLGRRWAMGSVASPAVALNLPPNGAAVPPQDPRDRRRREPPMAQQAEGVSSLEGDLAIHDGRLASLGGD